MRISYHNDKYHNSINIPDSLKEIDNHIDSTIKNLTSLNITYNQNLLDQTINTTHQFEKNKKKFIVLGTGGSNLGSKTLINIIDVWNYKKIYFYDNIDPIYFKNSLQGLDLIEVGFIIISKSGTTAETLSQFGSIIQLASEKNILSEFFLNCLVITEFKDSPLYNIAKKNNCILLEHDKDIGGRYSIFSNVGMVPSIIGGLDVKEVHKGAREVIDNENNYNFKQIGQLFKFQTQPKFMTNVIMTYSDALYNFGKWYLQLWAESIGKNKKGITAIHSIGTTDQHSQLQLYLDGPEDKYFTFITTDHSGKGLKINKDIMKSEKLNYLADKKMGDVMQAEQKSTLDTFVNNNLQFRNIHIPKINSFSMGSLIALSIMETVAACIYFEVNPFNQPAVEQGKLLTKKYLS